ncbi:MULTISPECIES: hypothetical protein [Candidatus Ichthyocystis]|uniref:hypothetical protein n=1 Tax=Candidatus Ichthyocystis TaxID=2929841 RepID=UPI000B806903|nr:MULTISPECIES: hypothetical protein [Ichthyocystis]
MKRAFGISILLAAVLALAGCDWTGGSSSTEGQQNVASSGAQYYDQQQDDNSSYEKPNSSRDSSGKGSEVKDNKTSTKADKSTSGSGSNRKTK